MPDPISERTAELEQQLKNFQKTVDARTDAPPLPLTAPVDPNAPAPITFQTSYTPAQEPEQAAVVHAPPPTWDEVQASPDYQSSNHDEKLVAFSRWHDAAYNYVSKQPDWAQHKDAFNQSAADEEKDLMKNAGGLTPAQAKVKIAKEDIAAAGATTKQAERDVLKQLGPDVAQAYLYDKLGVKENVLADPKLINMYKAQGMNDEQANAAAQASLEKPGVIDDMAARIMLKPSSMLNSALAYGAGATANLFRQYAGEDKGLQAFAKMSGGAEDYFKHAADISNAAEHGQGNFIDTSKDDTVPAIVADTVGTILATAPASLAAALVPEAAIPAALTKVGKFMSLGARATGYLVKLGKMGVNMIPVGTEFAGDAAYKAHEEHLAQNPGDEDGANKAAATAAFTSLEALPAYALGLSGAGAIEGKVLPRLMNPIARGGVRFLTGTAGNIVASEGLKAAQGQPLGVTKEELVSSATFAAHPAVEAIQSEKAAHKFVPQAQAIMKGTDAKLMVFDLMAKDEELPPEMKAKAQESADAMRKDAAAFLAKHKIKPEEPTPVEQNMKDAAEGAAKAGAPQVADELNKALEQPASGENQIVLDHEIGHDGSLKPVARIPDDATLEHLQEAKAEVAKNYAPDSDFAIEFNKQLDEAIAAKQKEYAPAGAPSVVEGPGAGGESVTQPGVRDFLEQVKKIKEGPGTPEEKADKIHEASMAFVVGPKPENVVKAKEFEKPTPTGVRLNDQNMIEAPAMDLDRVRKLQIEVEKTGKLPSDKILLDAVGPEMIDGFKKWASQHIEPTNIIKFPESATPAAEAFERMAKPRIEGPALVDENGKVIEKGKVGETHADLMDRALGGKNEDSALEALSNDKQHAFVDSTGKVHDRASAMKVARAAGQLHPEVPESQAKLQSQHLNPNAPLPTVESPALYHAEENKLGRYDLPPSGTLSVKDFKVKGSAGGKLSDAEIDLYRELVPEAFTKETVKASPRRVGRTKVPSTEVSYENEKVNVPKLIQGLEDHGPVLEVKKFGDQADYAGSTNPIRRELATMRHEWYDNQDLPIRDHINAYVDAVINEPERAAEVLEEAGEVYSQVNDLNPDPEIGQRDIEEIEAFKEHARKYAELNNQLDDFIGHGDEDFEDYKWVSPKEDKDLPGYTVGLVRLPRDEKVAGGHSSPAARKKAGIKFTGPHFEHEDTNVVAFYRGYEETLPDGTKAFHIIEVQSDWAAQAKEPPKFGLTRENRDRLKEAGYTVNANNEIKDSLGNHVYPDKLPKGLLLPETPQHPLLKAYEDIALKAAIQHAKDIGATHVIVSDAETAMMTEGHDRIRLPTRVYFHELRDREVTIPDLFEPAVRIKGKISSSGEAFKSAQDGRYLMPVIPEGGRFGQSVELEDIQGLTKEEVAGIKADIDAKALPPGEPEQAGGMRLHYDKTLPSAMDEITGEKSKDVELGPHKGNTGLNVSQSFDTEADARAHLSVLEAHGLGKGEVAKSPDGRWRVLGEQPKGSPIFKDAEGNPKTQVTGRMWDVSKLGEDPLQLVELPKRAEPPKLPTSETAAPQAEPNFAKGDNKLALEKELFEQSPEKQKEFFALQRQAADVVDKARAEGQQTGVPLAKVDRAALNRSDRLGDLMRKHGATLADEIAKYQKIISEKLPTSEAPPGKPEGWGQMTADEKREWNKAEFAKQKTEAGNKPPAERPANWDQMTRAERSEWNKKANKERIAKDAAARKEARAERGEAVGEDVKQLITEDTLNRGVVPSFAEMKLTHPNMDITTAAELQKKLSKELAKKYPPEPTPEGSKAGTVKHEVTGQELPTIETTDADGVTRTQPAFSNNPDITAQQRDRNMFSNDEGNRLYVSDEMADNEQINPAIAKDLLYDKKREQYYVNADRIETSLGVVNASHDEALGAVGAARSRKEGAPLEQKRSYTQLYKDRAQNLHQITFGEKIEKLREAEDDFAQKNNLSEDFLQTEEDLDRSREMQDEVDAGHVLEIPPSPESKLNLNRRFPAHIAIDNEHQLNELQLLPKKGETFTHTNPIGRALEIMINDPRVPPWQKVLLKAIKAGNFPLNKINVEIHSKPNELWAGRFVHETNTMMFNTAVGPHLNGIRGTFLHELVHGILDAKMDPKAPRNAAEQAAYDMLTELHDMVSRAVYKTRYGRDATKAELAKMQQAQYDFRSEGHLGRDYYGLFNVREFITETLSNPKFQAILARLETQVPTADKVAFRNVIQTVKDNLKQLFAGIQISKTSVLDHAMNKMLELIESGNTPAGDLYEKYREQRREYDNYNRKTQETERERVRKDLLQKKEPDLGKIQDGEKLTRAQRSELNKLAYKNAREIAAQDPTIDVMQEFERQRERLKQERLGTSATFTEEGKAKMQEILAREAEEAKAKGEEDLGMSEEDLQREIAGEEEPEVEPEHMGPPQINLYDKILGNGWMVPGGKFLPVEERYHQGLVAGANPLVFGGHGSHGSAAWEHIQSDPKLRAAFEQTAKDKGYGSPLEMTEGDVKDFLEARGYLRVMHDGLGTYFTGKPHLNPAGIEMLQKHAEDNARVLAHDREQLGPYSVKELYRPSNLIGKRLPHEVQFQEVPPTSDAPAGPPEEEEDQAKVRYSVRAGAKRAVNIEGVPTEAQVDALNKQIDEDTGSSAATKQALKDQVAIAAKQQAPTLVERVQIKNPLTGKMMKFKDSGNEIVIAGADSAQNVPRILGEKAGMRVALDFGKSKKITKEQALDHVAMNFIIESGRDKHQLEIMRDRIANSKRAQSRLDFVPLIDRAIERFDALKGKMEHDKVMKEQLDREHSYRIETPEFEHYVTRLLDSPDISDNDMIAVPNGRGGLRYFTKARSYENIADAIHDGLVPKTLDIVELAAHRVEAGERLIQQKILHEKLKSVLAPDGKPIVGTTEPRATLYHGDVQQVPPGYEQVTVPGGAPLVVHQEYVPLFKAMYGDHRSTALARWAGVMKRNTLILDSFHVGRMMFKEAAYGKGSGRVGWGRGLSLLEYRKEDLHKALAAGDIDRTQYDYAMEHYENAQALINHGLNVAKISDNMNAELARALPFIKGFNPWVFGKLSRGAMMQSALANLERNQSRFGKELSREEVLRRTAREMNEVFGNLQMQSVFKDPQIQETMRALLLAPQWAESQLKSELRGYAQLLKAPVDIARGKFRLGVVAQGQLTAVMGMFAAMQVASLILNGHTTFGNKKGDWFNIHIPAGRAGFEFNPLEIAGEYAFMAYRYHSQHMTPADIIQRLAFNKLNPVPHGALNFLLNRDYSGKRYATQGDRARALIESAVPLPPLFGPLVERDPRQTFTLKELQAVRNPMDVGRLAAHTLGMRPTRSATFPVAGVDVPNAVLKTGLQSVGIKVSNAQTARTEMFALAHRYRDDSSYGDNSPPVYRELRQALDNRDTHSAQQEIMMLADRGKTEAQIRKAVGITANGIQPEKFTGKAERERLLMQSLTPEQKEIYKEAQADHKANAKMLMDVLKKMKHDRADLVKQLHDNMKKKTAKDFAD
jgi:hypothetical protein